LRCTNTTSSHDETPKKKRHSKLTLKMKKDENEREKWERHIEAARPRKFVLEAKQILGSKINMFNFFVEIINN
jgi:hypothetical protein